MASLAGVTIWVDNDFSREPNHSRQQADARQLIIILPSSDMNEFLQPVGEGLSLERATAVVWSLELPIAFMETRKLGPAGIGRRNPELLTLPVSEFKPPEGRCQKSSLSPTSHKATYLN